MWNQFWILLPQIQMVQEWEWVKPKKQTPEHQDTKKARVSVTHITTIYPDSNRMI
jgi:hypothetical protein